MYLMYLTLSFAELTPGTILGNNLKGIRESPMKEGWFLLQMVNVRYLLYTTQTTIKNERDLPAC